VQRRFLVGEATAPEEDVADLLVQAVVAPQSDLMSRTFGEVDFRRRYGALVVSLWRKEGWLQQELAQTRLSAGDVLVLPGDAGTRCKRGGEGTVQEKGS
jgi:uncharacterized protein with PhoU and TrkA domain